jgi:hypothetical protein
MTGLRFVLRLLVVGAAGGCDRGGEHTHVPEDVDDTDGTPDDSGNVDARAAAAGDAADQG